MNDLASLLAYCKLHPLEDAPRLVLADYLEEHGDADRAEFVRLQAQPFFDPMNWQPHGNINRLRALRLHHQHLHAWCQGFPHHAWFHFSMQPDEAKQHEFATGRWERGTLTLSGIPESVLQMLQQLPAHAFPWLERLSLYEWGDQHSFQTLLNRPELQTCTTLLVGWRTPPTLEYLDLLDRSHWRVLRVPWSRTKSVLLERLANAQMLRPHVLALPSKMDSARGLAALMASPIVEELRELLYDFSAVEGSLGLLAGATRLAKLKRLDLHGTGATFPVRDFRALCCSTVCEQLRFLTINGVEGGPWNTVPGLTGRTCLVQLRHLKLRNNILSTEDGEALAQSTVLENLTSFSFQSGSMTDGGLRALVQSPRLGPLECLDLESTNISDEGLEAVASTPNVRQLRYLNLSRCQITARGLRAVAESPYLSQLEFLGLGRNPLEVDALDALAASGQLEKLRSLQLMRLTIQPRSLERLVNAPVMRQVLNLDLTGVMLDTEHARVLARARGLTALRELSIHSSASNSGSLNLLKDAAWLHQLRDLRLAGMGVDDTVLDDLLPALSIGRLEGLSLEDTAVTSRGAETLLNWPGLVKLGDISLSRNNQMDYDLHYKIRMQVQHSPGEKLAADS